MNARDFVLIGEAVQDISDEILLGGIHISFSDKEDEFFSFNLSNNGDIHKPWNLTAEMIYTEKADHEMITFSTMAQVVDFINNLIDMKFTVEKDGDALATVNHRQGVE